MSQRTAPRTTNPPPWTAEGRANPVPWLTEMREQAPVAYHPELNAWGLFRYDDIRQASMNEENFSHAESYRDMVPDEYRHSLFGGTLPSQDEPEHTRHRNLLKHAFIPRAIATYRPLVEQVATTLLDDALATTPLEFVRRYAYPLPLSVIAVMLGIPDEPALFHRFIRGFMSMEPDPATGRLRDLEVARETLQGFTEYLRPTLEERRANPKDDLLSRILTGDLTGISLPREELAVKTTMGLFAAGSHTTQTLLTNAVVALSQHPDQLAKLRDDPSLAPQAIEEVLRFRSPAQATSRTVIKAFDIGGVTIPEGEKVIIWLQSANRDPRVFDDPDRFDVERRDNPHIAFGVGAHYCIGAPLARMEAEVGLRTWLERVPGFTVDPPRAEDWTPTLSVPCLRRLSMTITDRDEPWPKTQDSR